MRHMLVGAVLTILVGFSSSIECRNGHRKWRILTPVLATTTAARGGVGGGRDPRQRLTL